MRPCTHARAPMHTCLLTLAYVWLAPLCALVSPLHFKTVQHNRPQVATSVFAKATPPHGKQQMFLHRGFSKNTGFCAMQLRMHSTVQQWRKDASHVGDAVSWRNKKGAASHFESTEK